MDDMIYRHNSLAEENIDPNGRPAKNNFEEWSSEVSDHIGSTYPDEKELSDEECEKRIKEMDEVIKQDLERELFPLAVSW